MSSSGGNCLFDKTAVAIIEVDCNLCKHFGAENVRISISVNISDTEAVPADNIGLDQVFFPDAVFGIG